jgi:hypothetical protein
MFIYQPASVLKSIVRKAESNVDPVMPRRLAAYVRGQG